MVRSIQDVVRLIEERDKEIYQKGWQDCLAHIMATAGSPAAARPSAAPPKREPKAVKTTAFPLQLRLGPGPITAERPTIAVIHDIIKETPGLRGADIFRIAVTRVPGMDLKKMDRTGRTALARLKNRGKIRLTDKRWYPLSNEEEAKN